MVLRLKRGTRGIANLVASTLRVAVSSGEPIIASKSSTSLAVATDLVPEVERCVTGSRQGALQQVHEPHSGNLPGPPSLANVGIASSMHVKTFATHFTPMWNRDQEWRCRIEMIERARSFLYLSTFYIQWGRHACECLDALINAQQRGVSTVLLIDQFGQRLGGTQMCHAERKKMANHLQRLRDVGGKVVMYSPPNPIDKILGGGQHIKIQASEAGEAIFGSSNLSDSSFVDWNEFSVAVRGPIFDVLLANVRSLISDDLDSPDHCIQRLNKEESHLSLDYIAFDPNEHRGPLGLLQERENPISKLLAERIDQAKTSIDLTSFYFKPVSSVGAALKNASDRGVRVRVFHSHVKTLSSRVPWLAAATDYRSLLDHGVEIYENQGGEHSKIVIVDDQWATFGSYNLEDAADFRLAEAMMITEESSILDHLRQIFRDLHASEEYARVGPEHLMNWSFGLRMAIRVMRPFKRWF